MPRHLRQVLVLAIVAVAATRTTASSKAAQASSAPAAATTTTSIISTSSTSSTKRGVLHLPHMHAPHLQIPKGGFLFSPFRHQGGAHVNPSVIPTGMPATAAAGSVQDLLRPHPDASAHKAGATGSSLGSSPAGGDATRDASRSNNGEQHDNDNGNAQRYPHLQMKTFFQSLRSWTAFKQYCRGVRDLILIARPLESFLLRTGTIHDRDLSRFIARAIAFVAFTMIITSILGTMGLDTKPIIAGLGVSGFIVGFALKEIATNVLSGILLVFQRPFKTGWKIKVGSFTGTVLSIDSRYVRLLTDDDAMILVPAYQVYTQAITVIERKDKSGKVIPASGGTPGATATTAPPAGGVKSTPPSR